MANQLTTRFKFDDADGKKIDALRGKLIDFNDYANNTGSADFGKKINDNFGLAAKGAADFKTKTDDLSKPTFGGAYYEESKKISAAFKSNELAASSFKTTAEESLKSVAGLANAGANSLKRIGDLNAPASASALGKPDNSLYENVEKSRIAVQNLNKQQIDSGKFNGLTQSGVRLHSELGKVSADVSRINNQLSKTTNKSIISSLNTDLAAAEDNLARLNGRLAQYTKATKAVAEKNPSGSGTEGKIGKLRGYGALFREFAPTGINESAVNAATSVAEVAGIGTATLATFGAIAVAGAGIIKITQNIREEAEKHLKVQELIAGTINKQILSQQEALENLAKLRTRAGEDFQFNRSLPNSSAAELTRQRDLLLQLNKNLPANTINAKGELKPNEQFQTNSEQILLLEARIRQLPLDQQKRADDAFNQRNESFKKSQENADEAAKRVEAANKKREEDIKKGIERVKELGKQYNAVFDNLQAKRVADNPIAATFLEGQRAVESLKESIRGLSPAVQAQAIAMQRELNASALFSARLDNKLSALNLRDEADDFRRFKAPKITDPAKFFNDFLEVGLKQIEARNGGGTRFNLTGAGNSTFGFSQSSNDPYTRYHSNIFTDASGRQFTNGFSQSDARNDLLYNYDTVSNKDGGFGGFSRRQRSFADLSQREKDDFIRSSTDADGGNLKFQQKLDRQILAASNTGALTEEQRRIVDRKIISLTQGVDPSKLTEQQRDIGATVREREAERLERNNAETRQRDIERNEYLKRVAESNELLIQVANKGGASAVEVLVKNESNGAADVAQNSSAPRPTPEDTSRAYGFPTNNRRRNSFTNR